MKTFNIELTQNEAYFLYHYIGGISPAGAERVIREDLHQISEEPWSETLQNLFDLKDNSVLQSIFDKIETHDVKSPSKPIKKYRVLFRDRYSQYDVSIGHYTSREEFEFTDKVSIFVSLIEKSMIEVEE